MIVGLPPSHWVIKGHNFSTRSLRSLQEGRRPAKVTTGNNKLSYSSSLQMKRSSEWVNLYQLRLMWLNRKRRMKRWIKKLYLILRVSWYFFYQLPRKDWQRIHLTVRRFRSRLFYSFLTWISLTCRNNFLIFRRERKIISVMRDKYWLLLYLKTGKFCKYAVNI